MGCARRFADGKRCMSPGLIVIVLTLVLLAPAAKAQRPGREQAIRWWREARFGMFIHWGLYAVPAGEWEGRQIPGIGEWIMNRAKIPVKVYEGLARQFNPVKFNAEEWVRIARDAGMRYIVITAKHHDGFAMHQSRVSPYNIYDATPFHRDPMNELAEACRKAGLKLCFYYSHVQDWHHPDAVGNDWDFDPAKKDFQRYLREKAIPQVQELLTGYGPLGLIWYDTPRDITEEQSRELANLVWTLQPQCLVNGRVGHGLGDYRELGDNQFPGGVLREDWEVPVTMNDTWGYKKHDHNWKTARTLIRQLIDAVSKNGNYLLNVGPTAEGLIPQPSVDRLREVGQWVRANAEAVYGAGPSPYPYEFEWGAITTKPGKVFLHIAFWPKGEFVLYGLKNKVQKVYLLASGKPLEFQQRHDDKLDLYELRIGVPHEMPDPRVTVIVLEIEGKAEMQQDIMQQPDDKVILPAFAAEIHSTAARPKLHFDPMGVATGWTDASEWLSWRVRLFRPGRYRVSLWTTTRKNAYRPDPGNWDGGHRVRVRVGGQEVSGVVEDDGESYDLKTPYWIDVNSNLGTVEIPQPGVYTIELRPEVIRTPGGLGLTLRQLRLVPVA